MTALGSVEDAMYGHLADKTRHRTTDEVQTVLADLAARYDAIHTPLNRGHEVRLEVLSNRHGRLATVTLHFCGRHKETLGHSTPDIDDALDQALANMAEIEAGASADAAEEARR